MADLTKEDYALIRSVRRAFDDGLHLLKMVKVRLGERDELTAIFEETVTTMENLRDRWQSREGFREGR